MTSQPAYPGYATPCSNLAEAALVIGWSSPSPGMRTLGSFKGAALSAGRPTRQAATTSGLFPNRQAAGEALVKHAGYEVLR